MGLRFGRARANGRPGDEVGDVLRDDGIEKFRARRQAHAGDVEEQTPSDFQTGLDVLRIVQVRVVDETLPAYGGARFFKINAHHDFQVAGKFLAELVQLLGVFERAFFVVDGAGADDDEQARVFLVQNV